MTTNRCSAGMLALIAAVGLAGCDPDPNVRRDPEFDERLIQRYEADQAPDDAGADGRVTTDSGLSYVVLEPGTGRSPGYTDTVVVHYRGWNESGQVFDDSYKRNRPSRLRVDEVIDGWSEGIQLMSEGARYRFIIPPYLAYGARGAPPRIGPDETLVFEVELLEVE
ncbi:MAG: FKBP-type peptidyl-prolyl cis-trans isomerase [Planctomycetota bacterium]